MAAAADLTTSLHEYFQKACQSNHFMGAVSISVNGEAKFAEACGWADAEWQVANRVDTRFRTGSIAKQFTAASILLLHEQGKLGLTDAVGKFLPDLPEAWRSATIHQLLTHTSGVPFPSYQGPAWEHYSALATSPKEWIDLVRDKPLLYAHGTRFTYNNTGYFLLGMIIEKVSGMKYEDFVQKRLFDTLGMKDSGFDYVEKIIPLRARGYSLGKGGELENAAFLNPRSAWSAGGFYSTVHDMTVWSEALAHGKLLNADSTRRMFQVYPETAAYGMHYGYGQVIGERFNHKLQYHGGGIKGFNSVLQRYPDKGLVIVVFSNVDSDDGPSVTVKSWELGDGLAKIWFEEQAR
ncbi:MAG TPA: serine hydrolase domain-containing protein [Candidatus Angelobacter sp.]|jgi:CubicO group peptidase (beta-lactamase class C family)|nr:serine hydrolase domain-containing protein [Candidatus Angelobacter sp.]